jgi:hypothetical protein
MVEMLSIRRFVVLILLFVMAGRWSTHAFSVSSFNCAFSKNTFCRFYDLSTTSRNWIVSSSSSGKGPTFDHTGDGYYIYPSKEGQRASQYDLVLQLDFNISTFSTNISFAYYMDHSKAATLSLLTSLDNKTFTGGSFTVSGPQGSAWHRTSVTLPDNTVSIRVVC